MSDSNWIWGLHSVEAALENHPDLVLEVCAEGEQREIEKACRESGLKLSRLKSLPKELKERRTQGVAARLRSFPCLLWNRDRDSFESELDGPGHWALLDGVEDPRNYGAILRSAAAFGIKGVFVGERNQSPLTGVVAQASAGNLFRLRIIVAPNVSRALELKDSHFAQFLALDGSGENLPAALDEAKADRPLVWIVGSEGEGVKKSLLEAADQRVRIPMAEGVESLNASVAASIAFYASHQKFFVR